MHTHHMPTCTDTGDVLKVKVNMLVAQSCLTLCDPLGCSLQAPLSMGILQARILKWVAMPFFRASSRPRNQTWVSCNAHGIYTI